MNICKHDNLKSTLRGRKKFLIASFTARIRILTVYWYYPNQQIKQNIQKSIQVILKLAQYSDGNICHGVFFWGTLLKRTQSHVFRILCCVLFANRCRSSHPEMFCKKGVLINFANFTGNVVKEEDTLHKVKHKPVIQPPEKQPPELFYGKSCS